MRGEKPLPQSQNRSRATVTPEMDNNSHMTSAHVSYHSPNEKTEKTNVKKAIKQLQISLAVPNNKNPLPKKEGSPSTSGPNTPTGSSSNFNNSELMSKLQKRRQDE
jgi:hypothetical protein